MFVLLFASSGPPARAANSPRWGLTGRPRRPTREFFQPRLDQNLPGSLPRVDPQIAGAWADKPIHAWTLQPWNGFGEFVRPRILSVDDKRGEWRDD
ncbi:MAG: hypothetical protein PHQ04_10850 [Opitutaceae bacterium]|nr:hypothetical protein [Opitutaceae bacterium]